MRGIRTKIKRGLVLGLGVLIFSTQLIAKTYNIGVTQIVEHSVLDSVREGFEEALKDSKNNGLIDYNIEFQTAQGDMVTQQLIGSTFVSKKKDLILAISTPSAQALANSTSDIPILYGAVSDPNGAGLNTQKNITGVADTISQEELVVQTKKYFPNVKRIGTIYNTSEKNSELNIKKLIEAGKVNGIEVIPIGITALSEISMALDVALKKSDALYMIPDNTVVSAANMIYSKAKDKNIPVLAMGYNQEQIDMGGVLSLSVDYKMMGYRLGVIAVEILNGKSVKDFPAESPKEYPVLFNDEMVKYYNVEK